MPYLAVVDPLVADGTLSVEERDRLLKIAKTDSQGVGRAFGSKMHILNKALGQVL